MSDICIYMYIYIIYIFCVSLSLSLYITIYTMMSELAVWLNETIQSLPHRGTVQVASKSLHASMQCISAIQQEIAKLESSLDS